MAANAQPDHMWLAWPLLRSVTEERSPVWRKVKLVDPFLTTKTTDAEAFRQRAMSFQGCNKINDSVIE